MMKEIHENKIETSHNSKFLIQLYKILEDKENKDIIHWGNDNSSFIIENIYDFIEKILPKYYGHNNLASFVRQLNKYNFHKIKATLNEYAFQNEQFIKGKKDLISNILRKKKRKRDFNNGNENNITTLVKYQENKFLNNINNIGKNTDNENNFSLEKQHSLSLDEENESTKNIGNKLIKKDIQDNTFLNLNNNSNSVFKPFVNNQTSPLILKPSLINENNKINETKKISKKTVNDLLNDIINTSDKITKKQKTLNAKFDSLSGKNTEYINKNKIILKEIELQKDNNTRLEKFISFILEFKNNNLINNRLLLENDSNNLHQKDSNESLMKNFEIINSAEKQNEKNNLNNTNEELLNKKPSENEYGSFQSFFNKYFERKKNNGLLMSCENNNPNNNFNFEQKNNNDLFIRKNSNSVNAESISKIDDSFSKDKLNYEVKNSSDNYSTIFKRNRSNSFHSLLSNNISDNSNKEDNFLFGNFNQNNDNINNRSEIIWNNNIDSNNILNKSFDADFSQDKNINRKDSLNNSSYSFIDLQSKN